MGYKFLRKLQPPEHTKGTLQPLMANSPKFQRDFIPLRIHPGFPRVFSSCSSPWAPRARAPIPTVPRVPARNDQYVL